MAADIVTPVTVMFGTKKPSAKALKPNPSRKNAPMVPAPMEHTMVSDEPPSHEERLHNAAADEHVHAARDYVGGRISHAQYKERKNRAAKIMAQTPKNTK